MSTGKPKGYRFKVDIPGMGEARFSEVKGLRAVEADEVKDHEPADFTARRPAERVTETTLTAEGAFEEWLRETMVPEPALPTIIVYLWRRFVPRCLYRRLRPLTDRRGFRWLFMKRHTLRNVYIKRMKDIDDGVSITSTPMSFGPITYETKAQPWWDDKVDEDGPDIVVEDLEVRELKLAKEEDDEG